MSLTWDGDLYWVRTIEGHSARHVPVLARDRDEAMRLARIETCEQPLDACRVPEVKEGRAC